MRQVTRLSDAGAAKSKRFQEEEFHCNELLFICQGYDSVALGKPMWNWAAPTRNLNLLDPRDPSKRIMDEHCRSIVCMTPSLEGTEQECRRCQVLRHYIAINEPPQEIWER